MGISATTGWTAELSLANEAATGDLARSMRHGFLPADVVLLRGGIGVGKTFFARALIQALLSDCDRLEDVPSPTFTLVQTYRAGTLEIWHSDLYRLSQIDEVDELGLLEAFETALCLVEWPEKLGAETPYDALLLDFGIGKNPGSRGLRVIAKGEKWQWLKPVLAANGGVLDV